MERFLVKKDGEDVFVTDTPENREKARAKGFKIYEDLTSPKGEQRWVGEDLVESAVKDKGYDFTATRKSKDQYAEERKERLEATPKIETGLQAAASTMAWGADDEAGGVVNAGIEALKGNGFDYERERDAIRQRKKNVEEANPLTHAGTSLVTGVLLPGGAAKGATMAGKIASGAGIGAVQGGVQSFNESDKEGAEAVEDALSGSVLGAVLGGAGGALAAKLAKSEKPDVNDIKSVVEKAKSLAEEVKESNAMKTAEFAKDAFTEGAKRTDSILEDLPVVGGAPARAVRGTINAAKELIDRNQNSKAFREMVDGFRTNLGPDAIEGLSDEDVIIWMLMEPGSNPAKTWVAKGAASVTGVDSNDFGRFLDLDPDTTRQQRLFNKIDSAEEAAGDVASAHKDLSSLASSRYQDLNKQARDQFQQIGNDPVRSIAGAMQEVRGRKTISDSANNVLSDAFDDLVGDGSVGFSSLDPKEQFDRIQKAKRLIDRHIKWGAVNEPPESQALLERVRNELRSHVHSYEAMKEADKGFSTFKTVEKEIFEPIANKSKGRIVDFDPIKLEKVFSNAATGRRWMKNLEKAEELLASGQLNESESKTLTRMIEKVRGMAELADGKRALDDFRQRAVGPTGPAVQALGAKMRGDGFLDSALSTQEKFLRDRETIADLAKDAFGSSYKNLTRKEQQVVVQFAAWRRANPKAGQDKIDSILETLKAKIGPQP